MAVDAWLPVGLTLPDGAVVRVAVSEGPGWQIVATAGSGRALIATEDLAGRWVASGLLEPHTLSEFSFAGKSLRAITSGPSQLLCPVCEGRSPGTKAEALAFALALRETRNIDRDSPLQDAIYVERLSRLLPSYSISSRTDDDVVLGYWLTGGAHVSAKAFRRLHTMLSWMDAANLTEVVQAGGFAIAADQDADDRQLSRADEPVATRREGTPRTNPSGDKFTLPGRPELEAFFNEHVVDIVTNRERYQALGIGFPSAIVLHGPPGCGKTFAVERLVDFLGWPSFKVEASTIASPYIHETSKKVAQLFDQAIDSAPSVLIIDEMDAFLADRQMGTGHHRVEEMAEFLRRIPEATKSQVLIFAMTNRLEMMDPAILRRGRFDHLIRVDPANSEEVRSLLEKLLESIPKDDDVDVLPLADTLAGRPLSDVAFIVREGARLAARSGRQTLNQASLMTALNASPAREPEETAARRIGFI